MTLNPALFRSQHADGSADRSGGVGPASPSDVAEVRRPEASGLEALQPVPGQPSLKDLPNEAILDRLRWFKDRENRLQSEVVIEAVRDMPSGARSLDAWRKDWKEFLELRKSVERLYLAEAIRRGIHEDGRGYTTLVNEVSEIVAAAIESGHAPVLRLMALHTSSDNHEFLESQQPEACKIALQDWKFPLGSVDMLRLFLKSVVLEEVKEGEGVDYLKRHGKRVGKRIPAPVSSRGASQEPRTFWGKVRDFLLEDRF